MKVLITRPSAQSESFGKALLAAGFEPIYFPVIEIRPLENNTELDNAIKNIDKYSWVIFTSTNAVDIVFEQIKKISTVKIAAIGSKTAEALRQHNIEPDFVPDEYIAEAILPGLGNLKNKWVLLPRAEIARKELPEAIVKAGGIAHEIVVYQTLSAVMDMEGLNALKSGVDVVTFTSASTVENFFAMMRQNSLDPLNLPHNPLFACIGPVTEQAAREEGINNLVVAEEYTTEGLIKAINKLGVHHAQRN